MNRAKFVTKEESGMFDNVFSLNDYGIIGCNEV